MTHQVRKNIKSMEVTRATLRGTGFVEGSWQISLSSFLNAMKRGQYPPIIDTNFNDSKYEKPERLRELECLQRVYHPELPSVCSYEADLAAKDGLRSLVVALSRLHPQIS